MSAESDLLIAAAQLLEHAARLLPGMQDQDLVSKRAACKPTAASLRALAQKLQDEKRPELTAFQRSAPERVWINVFGLEEDYPNGFPENHEDITWCQDPVGDLDIPYVRADLACLGNATQETGQATSDTRADLSSADAWAGARAETDRGT